MNSQALENLLNSPDRINTVTRLTVTLCSNKNYIHLTLNDRNINNERYSYIRETDPVSEELKLINAIGSIVGIRKVDISKNTIILEISNGMLASEVLPDTIQFIKDYTGHSQSLKPFQVKLDDRREDLDGLPDYVY